MSSTAFSAESSTRVPDELQTLPQWVAWWSVVGEDKTILLPNGKHSRALKRQGKPHKLPINPISGGLAATNRRETWGTFEAASAARRKWSLTGMGFVFTEFDPYAGVDIDNCRNAQTGVLDEWAWDLIRSLDSYTEVSPSGTGVHIIVRGALPAKRGNQVSVHGGKVEVFSRARYFTVTGIPVAGTPAEISDRPKELLSLHAELFNARSKSHDGVEPGVGPTPSVSDRELILRAARSRNGPKFDRLWNGIWQGDYPSQSEADLALCCLLAFWTNRNVARIDSLFRQSGLMREKWSREDYRERTLEAALAKKQSGYRSEARGRTKCRVVGTVGVVKENDGQDSYVVDLVKFPHTDTGNAERLVSLHGGDIRFCPEIKRWLYWDGQRWRLDDSRQVKKLFKKTIRETYRQATDVEKADHREALERHARKSESAAAINAAVTCAEYEEGISIPAHLWDDTPDLLNCKNGTLDLRTGQLRPHKREDLITKLVNFDFHADAICPRFHHFLHRILGEESERGRAQSLAAYLQKCFGYSLTGNVSEKTIFCFFGSGNNGKTTLLEAVRSVVPEYSAQVLIDSLMAHKSRESSACLADLADLRGARFVTSSEAEEGHSLAIARLKYLSQGMGEIKVCRKYENPFVITCSHKLFLDANHMPRINGSDEAIWRRIKAVCFNVTIPPAEIDKTLGDKLKAEGEGILAWMVAGCLRWRAEGLGDPPEVIEAVAAWRAESDNFKRFFEETYVVERNAWLPAVEVWPKYQLWCESNQEKVQIQKSLFDKRLEELGCHRGRRSDGTVRAWVGIRYKTAQDVSPIASDEVTTSDSEC